MNNQDKFIMSIVQNMITDSNGNEIISLDDLKERVEDELCNKSLVGMAFLQQEEDILLDLYHALYNEQTEDLIEYTY